MSKPALREIEKLFGNVEKESHRGIGFSIWGIWGLEFRTEGVGLRV